MPKKIFVFLITTIVFFTSFFAYKRIINAANDENPSSGYNPEEHFERVLAEDQNTTSPEGSKRSNSFKTDSTIIIHKQ